MELVGVVQAGEGWGSSFRSVDKGLFLGLGSATRESNLICSLQGFPDISSQDVIAISIVEGRKVSGRFCGAMSFARSHLSLCQMITDPKKSISSREL